MSQIRTSATAQLICRFCRRKLTLRGMFWADEDGDLFCYPAHGPHTAVAKEPETS